MFGFYKYLNTFREFKGRWVKVLGAIAILQLLYIRKNKFTEVKDVIWYQNQERLLTSLYYTIGFFELCLDMHWEINSFHV